MLYDVPLHRNDGSDAKLGEYKGDVLLVVNVASECGLTPQYTGLQRLHEELSPKGLRVLAFPCNQFGAQEPGTNAEIAQFCETSYGVTFPLFDKLEVNGAGRHPLYNELIGSGPDITWNFEKFLIDREGNVAARFAPDVTPEDHELRKAIDRALQ